MDKAQYQVIAIPDAKSPLVLVLVFYVTLVDREGFGHSPAIYR